MKQAWLEAWAIVGLALVLALVSNHVRGMPLRPGERIGPGIMFVTPEQAQQLLARGAVALDVRSDVLYELAHLEGACRLVKLPARTTLVVVYGSGPGGGEEVAGALAWLQHQGFTRVAVMPAGYSGWQEAGLPVRR